MNVKLIRYWVEFSFENYNDLPAGISMGCGVTAYSQDDAIRVLNEKVFREKSMCPIKKLIENVDIRILDQNHVIPNMKTPAERGVWFPVGYD